MAPMAKVQSTIYVQIVVLCILCIKATRCQAPPLALPPQPQPQPEPLRAIIIHPQDTEVPNGKVVELRCVINGTAENCSWTRNEQDVSVSLLQFTGNRTQGDCSIQFDAQDTTSGRWQCGLPSTAAKQQAILSQIANVRVSGISTAVDSAVKPGLLGAPPGTSLADADYFVMEPSNTTIRTGDNTVLKCVFKTGSGSRTVEHCYWENNGNPVEVGERYAFVGDRTSGDCSLSITTVSRRMDEGAWHCGLPRTQSFKGAKSREAYLTVAVAPKEPRILQDGVEVPSGNDLGVKFNEELVVTCQSDVGNPAADLQWTLGGMEMAGTDEIVPSMGLWTRVNRLRQLMTDDWRDKELRCTATHPSYDDGQEHFTFVIIRPYQSTQKAAIICRSSNDPQRTITLQSDGKADFECRADGNPKPEYRWQTRADDNKPWTKLLDNVQNLTVTGSTSSQQVRCVASNDHFQNYAYSEHWTIIAADQASNAGMLLVTVPLMIICTLLSSLKNWFI